MRTNVLLLAVTQCVPLPLAKVDGILRASLKFILKNKLLFLDYREQRITGVCFFNTQIFQHRRMCNFFLLVLRLR